MRLATYQREGREQFGLVLCHPADGADWVFDPSAVEAAAAKLPALKGAGYTWWRPDFVLEGGWPRTLVELLARGTPGMMALRRLEDFLRRFLEQGDLFMLANAGWPVDRVVLQAPIPEPRLLLGVVGNNPGFLRMEASRGRNLQQPKCHQRTQTSIVGPNQPIVLPRGCRQWAGTTELAVVIGRGGRNIPREKGLEHIAGYTVVNDGLGSLFATRWSDHDREAGVRGGSHYHSANSASWLDKKADTMLAMGPWLVTPEEVGNPYDLMAYYRENGVTRSRGHSGALCSGIEELIHWVSQFLTLEPGMVLHLGAMGQDGLAAGGSEDFGPGYTVECEIERLGVLRNPLVALGTHDWRDGQDAGRNIHPSPLVRKLIAEGRSTLARPSDWQPGLARHFWTLLGNDRDASTNEGIERRTYPLAYNAPASSLRAAAGPVIFPPAARTISVTCELGVVIKSLVREVGPEDVRSLVLGYVTMAVFRDSSFQEALIQPHVLQAGLPAIYSRWPEGFNVCGPAPVPLDDFRSRRMFVEITGMGVVENSTDAYLLEVNRVISELSQGITLLPGDVIACGRVGTSLTLPAHQLIPPGTVVRAGIEGLGEIKTEIVDQRAEAR